MNRAALRRLERLHPILRVPETAPGPVEIDPAHPGIRAGRRIEARYEREPTGAQRLSLALAHHYRRDVFCEGNLQEGRWAEELPDGQVGYHHGDPSRAYLTGGRYRALKVAPDVARRVLDRDRDMPVPQAWRPPAEERAVEEWRMPTLSEMLAAADEEC
jgi:hypothetical protein